MHIKVIIEIDGVKSEVWEKEIKDHSNISQQINDIWDFTKKVSHAIANRGAGWFISQRKNNVPI